MVRRLSVVVVIVAIALQLNVTPVAAIYSGSCDTAQVGGLKWTNERSKSNPGIDGVIVEVDARMLIPCTPGILGFFSSASGSLQSSLSTTTNIVQIGILRCSKPSGCGGEGPNKTGAVPADGRVHFFYSKNDNAGGLIFLADSWYGSAPTLGKRYRMKIQQISSTWTYYIRNVTTGQAYVTHSTSRTWGGGTYGWWGGEVVSANDAMGTLAIDPELDLHSQYLRGGTWFITNGADQACVKRKDDSSLIFPAYYKCLFVTQSTSLDTMEVHTVDHLAGDVP